MRITPISAFLALAQPGRSCLLESVEGTDRISRYSFIGIDYLESRVFDDDPAMLDGIRELIGKYDLDTSALPFPGGAVCVFTYDAARQFEQIGPKPPSDIPFSDALVVVPGHVGRVRSLHPSRYADRFRARRGRDAAASKRASPITNAAC